MTGWLANSRIAYQKERKRERESVCVSMNFAQKEVRQVSETFSLGYPGFH